MIRVFIEGGDPDLGFLEAEDEAIRPSFRRNQRELDTAQILLNQAVQNKPTISLKTVLVTPTPTMSTFVETTSYVTTVVEEIVSKVPIILRGNKVITTIIEPTTVTGKEVLIDFNCLLIFSHSIRLK